MHKGIYSVQGEICFLSHKHSTALTPLTVAEPELCLHEEQKLFPCIDPICSVLTASHSTSFLMKSEFVFRIAAAEDGSLLNLLFFKKLP